VREQTSATFDDDSPEDAARITAEHPEHRDVLAHEGDIHAQGRERYFLRHPL
jgi:hypothetical protein